jgi:hypothetical protein
LGMGALERPSEAVYYVCRSVSNARSALVSAYKDEDRVRYEEQQWQRRAIELLLKYGNLPVTRDIFDSLSDYDRGLVADREYPNSS